MEDLTTDTTPEGRQRWADHVKALVMAQGLTLTDWHAQTGIPDSTFGDRNRKGLPALRLMRKIAGSVDYPVVSQIADLASLRVEEIAPPNPFDRSHASVLGLQQRVDHALRSIPHRRPSVTDIARTVLDSSARERVTRRGANPYARWRARLFDVPMGWMFPHVGYHGVEFMRWYGPGRGRHQDEYPSSLWWETAPSEYSKAKVRPLLWEIFREQNPPAGFAGDPDVWPKFRDERLELVARMGGTYARAELVPYGGFGEVFRTLLRHHDGDPARHIFTQQASWSHPDPALAAECIDPDVRMIVIAGPGSVRPNPVGSLVAHALGWEAIGFRGMQAIISGNRPFAAGNRALQLSDNTWKRLHAESLDRHDPLVVTTNIEHLLYGGDGGHPEPTAAVRALLDDPRVLTIFLCPTDTSHTAHQWEKRAAAGSAGGHALNDVTSDRAREMNSAVAAVATGRANTVTLDIHTPYLHWGDAYVADLSPDDAEIRHFLWHPLVGDVDVRVAVEITQMIVARCTVDQLSVSEWRDNLNALNKDSVLGRYAPHLGRLLVAGRRVAPSVWSLKGTAHAVWKPEAGWDAQFLHPATEWPARLAVHQHGTRVTTPVVGASGWLSEARR